MKKRFKRIGFAVGIVVVSMAGCSQQYAEQFDSEKEAVESGDMKEVSTEDNKLSESVIDQKSETELITETESESILAYQSETEEPSDEDLVRVQDYIPTIVVDLKYATEDNFTGTVIYDFTDAYLRYGTVKKLAEAEMAFEAKGMRIKIWDAYRPVEAQERLWEVYPDPIYVADPSNGITSHSRGDTIDCTLVYMDGSDVEMPTGFDDFSALADRYYDDCTETAAANARMMEEIMYAYGFNGYEGEWWDYSDTTQYW